MGNYKFSLSDMMPYSWFYKLKDMGKPRKKTTSHSKKKKQPAFASSTCTQPSKPKQLVPHQHHHQCLHSRKSYYFTRELGTPGEKFSNSSPTDPKASNTTLFHDPPRKSSKQKLVQKRINTRSSVPNPAVTSSVSAGCSCRATIESVWAKSDCPPEYSSLSSSGFDTSPEPPELHDEPEFRCDRVLATETFDGMVSLSTSTCVDSNEKDIVIDVDKASLSRKLDIPDGLDSFSELELAPIITKLPKFSDMVSNVKKKKEANKEPSRQRRSSGKVPDRNADGSLKEQQRTSTVRRISSSSTSPGVRLRLNSPRIASRRLNQGHGRRSVSSSSSKKSLSDSFAIVKSSFDPQRDFRESMVEMIMENNIKASKDLEDLLACYLSLNSDEYHELIIKVFKQIWFDLTDIQSK